MIPPYDLKGNKVDVFFQTTLGVTIGNLEEKAVRDRENEEREVEERLRTSAETVAVELGESLQERLEQVSL